MILVQKNATVTAILNTCFFENEAVSDIADVLFRNKNPSGIVAATFPRSVGQVPIYYNQKNTERTLRNKEGKFEKFRFNYLNERNEPLISFSSGLH